MRVPVVRRRPAAALGAVSSTSMPHTGSVSGSKTPAEAALMRLSESSRKLPDTTTRSPSIRPLTICTRSPRRHPVSTRLASKYPLPRSTNTVFRRPESKTASAGTVTAGGMSTSNSTSTNMSGWRTWPGLSSSKRVFSVRDCASNWGSASLMRALSRRP